MEDKDQSAFPEPFVNDPNLDISHTKGMTLRDYFAAKAMPIVFDKFFRDLENKEFNHPGPDWREYLSQDVYKMAYAMLKMRDQ